MRLDISEINEELDIEFYMDRESVPFRHSYGSSGMQLQLKDCPACGDTRWRTYINAETGMGNCFVCDESFNKVKFVKLHQDTDWRGAFQVCRDVLKEQGWRPKRTVSAAVEVETAEVKLPFSHALPTEDGENLVYLEKRGINGELARYFNLRWCEFGWWAYKKDGETKKAMFNNRVIIPVHDIDGELVTFQGRDLTGKSDRKYLFPATLPGTGRYLYNGQNVHLTNEVVLNEGAFDVIATKKALDEEVSLRHVVPIGSFGKHLSYGSLDGNDQLGRFLKLKRAGLEIVTIMWDGEKKALVSALNAAKLLTSIGLKARIALLPADRDPNEVLPEVVRDAYFKAHLWSPALDVKWRLRNPFDQRVSTRAKIPVSAD